MKILAISDLHGRPQPLEYLDQALGRLKPDLVLCTGDITEHRSSALDYLQSFLTLIKKTHGRELFAIHGNNDGVEVFDLLEATGVSLHLKIREFGGYRFSGIGGWGDLSERVLDQEAAEGFSPAGTVFLTHVPPRYTEAPLVNLPLIHLCGHAHSVERVEEYAGIKVVRIKTAMLGRGCLLELPSLETEFIDLTDRP